MRRTQLHYAVQGFSHKDLLDKALALYREYSDDPESELPAAAIMEVRRVVSSINSSMDIWEAEVTIPITT